MHPPHSNACARPSRSAARSVSAMAGISSSGADAAPLSPPLEPPAAKGHGGSLHPPGSPAAPAPTPAPAPTAPALNDAALSAVAVADRSPLALTPPERYLLRDVMRPSDRLAGLLGVSVVGGAG
jgi:hypothetical protein